MLESDSFNHEIFAGETVLGAWSSPIVHIGRFFQTVNKFSLFYSSNRACHAQKNLAVT